MPLSLWTCPVVVEPTCCESKSLKVILIDSDFRAYPHEGGCSIGGVGDTGGVVWDYRNLSSIPSSRCVEYTLCRLFQTCRRIEVYLSLKINFTQDSHECIGGRRLTSNVTWTPTFGKHQLVRKGLSQFVQNHNQHRVVRIEPVF